MAQQRQAERHQLCIESADRFVRRVDGHDVRNPFDQYRAVSVCLAQTRHGIVPVGIDAGPEAEVVVACCFAGDEGVGHVDLRCVAVQLAGRIDYAVESQHHGLGYPCGSGNLGADPGDHQAVAVYFELPSRHSEGAQIEGKAPALAHLLINERAAAASADAGGVYVHVQHAFSAGRCFKRGRGNEREDDPAERG